MGGVESLHAGNVSEIGRGFIQVLGRGTVDWTKGQYSKENSDQGKYGTPT